MAGACECSVTVGIKCGSFLEKIRTSNARSAVMTASSMSLLPGYFALRSRVGKPTVWKSVLLRLDACPAAVRHLPVVFLSSECLHSRNPHSYKPLLMPAS